MRSSAATMRRLLAYAFGGQQAIQDAIAATGDVVAVGWRYTTRAAVF